MAAALLAALCGLGAAPVPAATNLRIDKTGGTFVSGDFATFTIVLSNPAVPATPSAFNVGLVDPLPGTGVVAWGIDSQTLLIGCNIEGDFPDPQTLSCDTGTVLPGQVETVVVSGVAPDTCLRLDNTAIATSADVVGNPYPDVQGSASVTVTNDTCRPLFVIGNKESHAVGDVVNFWGAQWWKNNSMTGPVSSGVASFKGYASDADNFCGPAAMWEARPGNSSQPPATIPADVMVVVTDTVQKDGPDITGTVKQILLVHSDGGYGPAPGHRGNGTVISVVCGR